MNSLASTSITLTTSTTSCSIVTAAAEHFVVNNEKTMKKRRKRLRSEGCANSGKSSCCSSDEEQGKQQLESGTLLNQNANKVSRTERMDNGRTSRLRMSGSPELPKIHAHCPRQLQHTHIKQKPRAPNNTTSFLMSDREVRQHEGNESHCLLGSRPRCYSTLGRLSTSETMDIIDPTCETDGGQQQDADFEECLLTNAIERIERLSREEVNRELLISDRDNRTLLRQMANLRESQQQLQEENQKLKSLLELNGIMLEDAKTKTFR